MAHLRVMLLGLVVASWSGAGCLSPCHCIQGGGFAQVAVPAAESSPIVAVSTNAPCRASATTSVLVDISTYKAGTCEVRVQLMNGDTYAFSVAFEPVTVYGACECPGLRTATMSAPELTDAGVDGLR